MSKLLLLVRIAVALALLAATPSAQAGEPACAARALVVKKLAERFGETLRSVGLHARRRSVHRKAASNGPAGRASVDCRTESPDGRDVDV